MENRRLDSEEMQTLRQLQEKAQIIASELGQIEMMRLQFDSRREEIMSLYDEMKEEEIAFGKVLSEKYGDGTINPETGEFITAPEFQGNPA